MCDLTQRLNVAVVKLVYVTANKYGMFYNYVEKQEIARMEPNL